MIAVRLEASGLQGKQKGGKFSSENYRACKLLFEVFQLPPAGGRKGLRGGEVNLRHKGRDF